MTTGDVLLIALAAAALLAACRPRTGGRRGTSHVEGRPTKVSNLDGRGLANQEDD